MIYVIDGDEPEGRGLVGSKRSSHYIRQEKHSFLSRSEPMYLFVIEIG